MAFLCGCRSKGDDADPEGQRHQKRKQAAQDNHGLCLLACRMLGQRRDSAGQVLLVHDCAGTRGVSGAPLLARGADGQWAVAGIASSVALELALGAAVPVAAALK